MLVDRRANINTLRFVHAVWRHGDRTPSILIPSDTGNNASTWELGLGELTKEGLAQEYRLGKFLRDRYDGFLSKQYSPFEIYIRSSDYNRTLISAQANMAALFAPTDEEMFVKDLRWRPIPVHTLPKHEDKQLFDRVSCPAAEAEEDRVYLGEGVKDVERQNSAMLHYLGEQSGYGKVPMPLRDIWTLFDPLNSESFHHDTHKFPSWVNATVWEEIERLYEVSSSYLYSTDLLKRLRSGPIFRDIVDRMKLVATGETDPREKFYAYSAHDTSVAQTLTAFGVTLHQFPLYASLVLIELHKVNGEYEIRLFYKNQTDKLDLWEQDIAGCGKPCSLSHLEVARAVALPLNWEEECGLYQWYQFSTETYIFIILCMLGIGVMLAVEVARITMAHRKVLVALQREQRGSRRRLLDPEEQDIDPEA
ncbi:Protein PHO-5 [Aphelenchoides avenae]|nr:Protein PHO-5 [Aphelenchus avenae]